MKVSMSDPGLSEVLVILPKGPGDLLLETSEFIPEIFQLRLYDSLSGVLLTKGLLQVIGLENLLSVCVTNKHIQKEAP